MKKRQPALKISEIVQKIIGEIDQKQVCSEDEVQTVWGDIVGEAGFKYSKPTSLQKGVLRVAVNNSCWIQELTIQKRGILKKLQTHFGKDKISDIRFTVQSF